jgi:hypothetical protein
MMVMAYLSESFGWTDELVESDVEARVKDVIAQVREFGVDAPAWIQTEADLKLWNEAKNAQGNKPSFGVTLGAFRSKKAETFNWENGSDKSRVDTVDSPVKTKVKNPSKKTQPDVESPHVVYIHNSDGTIKPVIAETKEYVPVEMPSLTSRPESEYDTVRFQTTADGDLCLNCGSMWQEGVRCCDKPRKGPGEGPAAQGEVPGNVMASKKVKAISVQKGEAYVKRFLESWEYDMDPKVVEILKLDLSDEEKGEKIKERVIELFNEIPDDDIKIKDADWNDPEIDWSDIMKVVEDYNDLNKESSMKPSKQAILEESLRDMELDSTQKTVVATLFENINDFTPDYLRTVGQFFTYEWDPGASWEVREVEGKKHIVRKEPEAKQKRISRHQFKAGQMLKLFTSFYPTDVKITALLGEDRYRVKSFLDGAELDVDENELILEDGKSLF